MEVLTGLPYQLDPEQVLSQIAGRQKKQFYAIVRGLLEQLEDTLSPRVLYKTSYIEQRYENKLLVEGVTFNSRIMRVNLETVERVFPYIITCGEAFEKFSSSREDLLESYYLDEIGNMVLRQIQEAFFAFLQEKYWLEQVGYMNPGSLDDWPLEEQKPLFSLFGEEQVKELINVELKHFMMHPKKSLSGIAFASKTGFKSCLVCPRDNCPGRKAPFDESMFDDYFR